MKKTLKEILTEYGAIAVVVYLVLFVLVFVGSYFSIRFGWKTNTAAGTAGMWTAAYIVTKLTQPLRIGMTVLLSAFVGKMVERRRKPESPA